MINATNRQCYNDIISQKNEWTETTNTTNATEKRIKVGVVQKPLSVYVCLIHLCVCVFVFAFYVISTRFQFFVCRRVLCRFSVSDARLISAHCRHQHVYSGYCCYMLGSSSSIQIACCCFSFFFLVGFLCGRYFCLIPPALWIIGLYVIACIGANETTNIIWMYKFSWFFLFLFTFMLWLIGFYLSPCCATYPIKHATKYQKWRVTRFQVTSHESCCIACVKHVR